MSKSKNAEILINISQQEIRVAIIENGLLQEVHIERSFRRGIVGNIYKGKVVKVLPGMQAAFVDIGQQRAGFLHVSDVVPFAEAYPEDVHEWIRFDDDIENWVKLGQEVLVQVTKDPIGNKGARLTAHLSLAARYVVYMPDMHHIGISLKLEDEFERERLRNLIEEIIKDDEPRGYILRTAAEGVEKEALSHDLDYLRRLLNAIQVQSKKVKTPRLIYEDLSLHFRTLRDFVSTGVDKVRVDSEGTFKQLVKFAEKYVPEVKDKLEIYDSDTPIFEMYGIEEELQNALKRNVSLKSGGYMVIDQTEAMTTIDINTGGYVGHRNLEDTIFKTNLEAAREIGRQLRLRNIGGIIIVDFIDMLELEHREQVINMLERSLSYDSVRTTISDISSLGLVQMTRKRTYENLAHLLCEVCPECDGRGRVKTVETVCYEIFREIARESKTYSASGFLVVAAEKVIEYLMNEESLNLGELESEIEKPIKLQSEMSYPQEQYDIILL